MSEQSKTTPVLGHKALEMVMRDVLYGMEDLATMLGYRNFIDELEILSVEPSPVVDAPRRQQAGAVIIDFPDRRVAAPPLPAKRRMP
jgi:hypothetical protein